MGYSRECKEGARERERENPQGPMVVCFLEALAVALLLKGPPASVSRQLPPSETVRLAVGSNCRQEIEEVENDPGSGIRFDTHGDEPGEGIVGKARVLRRVSRRPNDVVRCGRHALFSDLEQLVGIPGDHSSRESAPAPFDYTA